MYTSLPFENTTILTISTCLSKPTKKRFEVETASNIETKIKACSRHTSSAVSPRVGGVDELYHRAKTIDELAI